MVLPPELLGRTVAPVQFISGHDDPAGGQAVAEQLAQQFANAEVEMLPSAGHAPWIDEPDVCATLVDDFFAADQLCCSRRAATANAAPPIRPRAG